MEPQMNADKEVMEPRINADKRRKKKYRCLFVFIGGFKVID